MWSNNKKVDYLVNTLIFLVAINFMHYGQLFLPVICLILFIDNKFKFKVNNIKIFVVLCLFAISFCYFSYDLGFYCVMGFTLPMAYYIGSNIKKSDDVSVKKVIYIIAFGMSVYLLLDFINDYMVLGSNIIGSKYHYDVWTQNKMLPTTIAVNMTIFISLFYYVITKEKNKVKFLYILLFCLMFVYELCLGRRAPLFIFLICFVFSLFYDVLFCDRKIEKQKIKLYIGVFLITIAILVICYVFNFLGFKTFVQSTSIYNKFLNYGLNPGRLEYFFRFVKLAPYNLFGGQKISNIIGQQIHDLWSDVFDYAGVVTFVFMALYTIELFMIFVKMIKKRKNLNTFLLPLFVAIILQLLLEPIMTGSSIFMICVVIIGSIIETIRV